MFTPWKSLAVGLLVASSAQAGDLFKLAHNGKANDHRASYGGYGYCPNPWRCYPGLNLGIGLPYPVPEYAYAPPPSLSLSPPVYYYTTPPYPAPGGLNVVTYSTPNGAATYSVTQPAGGADVVPPPNGAAAPPGTPERVLPPPRPVPMWAPGHFHMAPLDELRAALPDRAAIRIEKR